MKTRRQFLRTASGLLVPALTGKAIAQGFGSFSNLPFFQDNSFKGSGSVSTPVDPLVSTWETNIVNNGGCNISGSATESAVNTFVAGLKSDSLDPLMISMVLFIPDCVIGAITPLYKVAGNDPWTNHNFVSGDLSTSGLQDQGTQTRYLQTGVNPTTAYASANDAGFTIYSKSSAFPSTGRMNAFNGGDMAGLYQDGSSIYTGAYTAWDVSPATSGLTDTFVFTSASRTAANAVAIYQANSSLGFLTKATAATGPGSRPNLELYAFCWNQNGVPTQFGAAGNHTYFSFGAIHRGLTAGLTQSLYNRVQTLRVSLLGGYA